jgi:hypothetical protein
LTPSVERQSHGRDVGVAAKRQRPRRPDCARRARRAMRSCDLVHHEFDASIRISGFVPWVRICRNFLPFFLATC